MFSFTQKCKYQHLSLPLCMYHETRLAFEDKYPCIPQRKTFLFRLEQNRYAEDDDRQEKCRQKCGKIEIYALF